jgi:hypothetical protein
MIAFLHSAVWIGDPDLFASFPNWKACHLHARLSAYRNVAFQFGSFLFEKEHIRLLPNVGRSIHVL